MLCYNGFVFKTELNIYFKGRGETMKTYRCDNCQMKIETNELDQKHPTTCPHCGEEALISEIGFFKETDIQWYRLQKGRR